VGGQLQRLGRVAEQDEGALIARGVDEAADLGAGSLEFATCER
jgi:hypothetical protein